MALSARGPVRMTRALLASLRTDREGSKPPARPRLCTEFMDRHVATDLACIVHKHVKVTQRFERLGYDAIRIALLRVVAHDHRTSTQEPRSLLERLGATSCQRHFVAVIHQRRRHARPRPLPAPVTQAVAFSVTCKRSSMSATAYSSGLGSTTSRTSASRSAQATRNWRNVRRVTAKSWNCPAVSPSSS